MRFKFSLEMNAVPTTLDAVERQMDVLRDAIRHYN